MVACSLQPDASDVDVYNEVSLGVVGGDHG